MIFLLTVLFLHIEKNDVSYYSNIKLKGDVMVIANILVDKDTK